MKINTKIEKGKHGRALHCHLQVSCQLGIFQWRVYIPVWVFSLGTRCTKTCTFGKCKFLNLPRWTSGIRDRERNGPLENCAKKKKKKKTFLKEQDCPLQQHRYKVIWLQIFRNMLTFSWIWSERIITVLNSNTSGLLLFGLDSLCHLESIEIMPRKC